MRDDDRPDYAITKKKIDIAIKIIFVLIGVLITLLTVLIVTTVTTPDTAPIERANEYLDAIPMSFPDLVEQLDYEFTYEEAIYGAANCGADWNLVAGRYAEDYVLHHDQVTRAELFIVLVEKNFTLDQAEFACDFVGISE